MNVYDLINFGKGLVETSLEKGLEFARVAGTQYRKAVETYNFLTELSPIPLPKLGAAKEAYEPYEPPPAPVFEKAKPEAAPEPKAAEKPKPAPKAAATPKPAPKAAPKPKPAPKADPVTEAKAAEDKAAEKKPKAGNRQLELKVVPDAPADEKPAAAAKEEAAPKRYGRSTLRKMRKTDLQRLCRENSISYQQTDTNAVLVERLLKKIGK